MKSPVSIKRFEKLFLASAALSLLATVIDFDTIQAIADSDGSPEMGSLFEIALTLIFDGLLWFFIVRRASNTAKWILVMLTVLWVVLLPSIYQDIARVSEIYVVLSGGSLVISLGAIAFLFTQESIAWLKSRGTLGPVDPDVFS